MNDISSIASAILGMRQSQTQEQISMSIMKMNADAEQAMANMLIENARQIQALSGSASNLIDLFV